MNAHPRGMENIRDANPLMDRISDKDILDKTEEFLACVIADNSLIEGCGLEVDDFEHDLHRTIFGKCQELALGGLDANPISLKPFVRKDMGLDISPAEYLTRLAILGTDPWIQEKAEANAQIIKVAALTRSVKHEGEFLNALAEERHSLLTLASEVEKLEGRLKERRERFTELRDMQSAGDAYLKMFDGSMSKNGLAGVPIALPEMAKVLSEPLFEAGNLYGLLSSSGEGKTSLTVQQIYHAIHAGHPVQFLSYDQSAGQCVRQMIAQNLGIEVRRQREPSKFLKMEEQNKCLDFAMWVNRQPLEIIRCQREGVSQLTAYGRRFVKRNANGKTPLIIIDHIGKVKPRDPKLSADRISGDVTVELKAFADETQAAVIILNQRNSEGTKRDNPRPIARDLYGGEGAKADYDAILFLYRPEKYREEQAAVASGPKDWERINRVFGAEDAWKGIAEVGVIKSRFGDPTLREELKFDAALTRYVSRRRQEPELF